MSYLLLIKHSHFKGFLYATLYLWLAGGCAASVFTAYWRSGGDVPGFGRGGPRGRAKDLESGIRKPLEEERSGFVIEDEDDPVDEGEGLLRRQAAEDAENLRLERIELAKEMRVTKGKMVARSATTRRDDRGGGLDMVTALRDLQGPPEGAARVDEWGSPRLDGSVQVKSDGRSRFCRKVGPDATAKRVDARWS